MEQLKNEFTVNRSIEHTWQVLTDLERIAPCMPGAQLQEVEGEIYRGVVNVAWPLKAVGRHSPNCLPSNSGFQAGWSCQPRSSAMPIVGARDVPMPATIRAMGQLPALRAWYSASVSPAVRWECYHGCLPAR